MTPSDPRAAIDPASRVLILGFAREGASLARYFHDRGAQVTVTDSAEPSKLLDQRSALPLGISCVLGGHHPELVGDADRFFVSPGVPPDNPVYQAAIRAGLPIESMTTLFFALCPARIVGITGSSGKTTTTSLIGHILRTAGHDAAVGGNIGEPMLDLLPRITPTTTVVLELSSFQLEILHRSPHIAVVTNISPNHLDRHGTMERYVAAKRSIVAHQSADDVAVLRADDPAMAEFAVATPAIKRWFGLGTQDDTGSCIDGGWLVLAGPAGRRKVMRVVDVPLLGRHNLENALAALAVADILHVAPETMAAAIRTFRPPAHRLELVGEYGGVRYVDDSIATSPARASVALEAIDRPTILIAGGRDKKLPWTDFARLVTHRVRVLILIGEAAGQIEEAVREQLNSGQSGGILESIHHCDSLEGAVGRARSLARRGDTVLLSPACTSYDMFRDFAERGAIFARAVEALDAA